MPVIRGVVRSFTQIGEREASRATQSKSQGGSDAIAPVLGDVTPGKRRIVSHQVQAESGPAAERVQRSVQIGSDPIGLVRAQVDSSGEESIGLRDFGFLIDDAAG